MNMNLEELSAYWDKKWSEIKEEGPNPFARKLIQLYNSADKPKLLELGCGDGRDLKLFIEKGFDVSAIEIATKSVEKLKERYGNKANISCQDIKNLNFANNSFDIIYAHLTLHYFTDEETTNIFNNIYNLLKINGIFFVKCKSNKDSFCNDSQGKKIAENIYFRGHVRHFFSLDYLKSKLNKFSIIEIGEEENINYHDLASSFVYAIVQKSK